MCRCLFCRAGPSEVWRSCEHDKKLIRQYIRPPGTQVKVDWRRITKSNEWVDKNAQWNWWRFVMEWSISLDKKGKNTYWNRRSFLFVNSSTVLQTESCGDIQQRLFASRDHHFWTFRFRPMDKFHLHFKRPKNCLVFAFCRIQRCLRINFLGWWIMVRLVLRKKMCEDYLKWQIELKLITFANFLFRVVRT